MTILFAFAIAALLFALTLASYVDRLYFEMGKFLAREFQENIDAWEQKVEPRLGSNRERIALSAAVLTQLSLACVTLLFGAMLFDRSPLDRPTFGESCAGRLRRGAGDCDLQPAAAICLLHPDARRLGGPVSAGSAVPLSAGGCQ